MKQIVLAVLVVAGVFVPVTFLPAKVSRVEQPAQAWAETTPATLAETAPEIQIDTIVIQIVADADSVIAVPNSVTVGRGQVVTWVCELGEWTVKFKSGRPFGDAAVGDGIKGNRGQRRGQAVRPDAEAGRYKYDIMVRIQGGRNLTADPEIVVGPGDGPGR